MTLSELQTITADAAPPSATEVETSAMSNLPSFLQSGKKVMFEFDGAYQKGFMIHQYGGVWRFSVRRSVTSKKEISGVDIPNFLSEWPLLLENDVLLPLWVTSSFLRAPSTPLGSASHVSAKTLQCPLPPSLLKALAASSPDRQVWRDSYDEEKDGLIGCDTFDRITLDQYCAYRTQGAPKTIPTMAVLTIKKDKSFDPDCAKMRIVALGNLEERSWAKHERFAPVLQYSSLRLLTSLAVEKRRILKQGDCKNAFVNATLPPDELTIVKPPIGDPDAVPGE